MEENEVISLLNNKIDALSQRVDELESVLFDELLNPMAEFVNKKEHETKVGAFGEAHPELADLKDSYATLNDDADVISDVYDAFIESGYPDENEYVEQAVKVLTDAITEAKRKLGIDVSVEAKPEEGKVEVKVEGADDEAEKPATETEVEENEEEEEEVENSPEEVAEFEKSLERYL
jgi:hypothetical protein